MGFKDIKYDIPVCHEGHKGHEGHLIQRDMTMHSSFVMPQVNTGSETKM